MTWAHLVLGAAGLASMKAAIEAHDPDAAARQGHLAGVAVVERALGASDRPTRLAGIAAAPGIEGEADLLVPLATVAAGPDRRVAIPAAAAARTIARALGRDLAHGRLSDEVARADVAQWRDAWARLALDRDRWIDLRVTALDTCAALERLVVAAAAREPERPPASAGIGLPIADALADPDPAFRRAALAVAPVPLPARMRAVVGKTIARDLDPRVALSAAQVLCADLVADPPAPILAALGADGLARLQKIISTPGVPAATTRDAARCLTAHRQRERGR